MPKLPARQTVPNSHTLHTKHQVNVDVKRGSNGLRGLYASRAVEQGELLVRVPLSAAVALGAADETGPVGGWVRTRILDHECHVRWDAIALGLDLGRKSGRLHGFTVLGCHVLPESVDDA